MQYLLIKYHFERLALIFKPFPATYKTLFTLHWLNFMPESLCFVGCWLSASHKANRWECLTAVCGSEIANKTAHFYNAAGSAIWVKFQSAKSLSDIGLIIFLTTHCRVQRWVMVVVGLHHNTSNLLPPPMKTNPSCCKPTTAAVHCLLSYRYRCVCGCFRFDI